MYKILAEVTTGARRGWIGVPGKGCGVGGGGGGGACILGYEASKQIRCVPSPMLKLRIHTQLI